MTDKQKLLIALVMMICCWGRCGSAWAEKAKNQADNELMNKQRALIEVPARQKALQQQINEFGVADEWLAIGHYNGKGDKKISSIDSPNFFLAIDGKTNPQAELEATIALFQSNDDKNKCYFPSRYKLLYKNGLITNPFPKCEEYEKFYDDLRPAGITMLFTDAYMNNPSSLFGHTLFRVDTKRKGTQLLAHGANYGAFTEGKESSVLYAVYGLTGGYLGGFTVKPYFDIINTYNNIENRDIWEFNLNFSDYERDFFVAHLWEVGQTQAYYYFFTRNCSYMLMEMLDAVRPSLKLAQKFPMQAIPLDTLKAVYRAPKLVKSVNYRPSRQNKIRYRYGLMNKTEKKAYLQAILQQDYKAEGLDEKAKANLAETAYQFVQYQYVAHNLKLEDYRKQSFKALMMRAKLNGNMPDLQNGKAPYESHESMRATWGAGKRNGDGFEEITYRPAYHSLTDDGYGFLRGAEINFLNTTLRHYDKENKYVLQKFDLLGIKSLSPIDAMFKPVSFKIMANVSREMNPKSQKEGYVANLTVGGGGTYALKDNMWIYALSNSHGAYGGLVPHNQYVGIGAEAGIFADWGKWRLLANAEKIWASNKFGSRTDYNVEAAYSLKRNWAVAIEYKYRQNYGHDVEEFVSSIRSYFY